MESEPFELTLLCGRLNFALCLRIIRFDFKPRGGGETGGPPSVALSDRDLFIGPSYQA
jgi:hypothetical protein